MRKEISDRIAAARLRPAVPEPAKRAYVASRRKRTPVPVAQLSKSERMRIWLTGIEDVMPRPVQSCCLKILAVSHYVMDEAVELTEEERESINRTLKELLRSNRTPRDLYTRVRPACIKI